MLGSANIAAAALLAAIPVGQDAHLLSSGSSISHEVSSDYWLTLAARVDQIRELMASGTPATESNDDWLRYVTIMRLSPADSGDNLANTQSRLWTKLLNDTSAKSWSTIAPRWITSTTDRGSVDATIAQIERYRSYLSGWDGEGAPAPDIGSIDVAEKLLRSLANVTGDLSPSLHADGRVVIERQSGGVYDEAIANPGGTFTVWSERPGKNPVSRTLDVDQLARELAT